MHIIGILDYKLLDKFVECKRYCSIDLNTLGSFLSY